MLGPHSMFVQTQDILCAKNRVSGWQNLHIKVLSHDDESCTITMVARYPTGQTRLIPRLGTSDVERLALDGVLDIDGNVYRQYFHANLPVFYICNSMTVGGNLANAFGEEGIPIDYDEAPDKPIVPDGLEAYAKPTTNSFGLRW